jgi:hypothetical protein
MLFSSCFVSIFRVAFRQNLNSESQSTSKSDRSIGHVNEPKRFIVYWISVSVEMFTA